MKSRLRCIAPALFVLLFITPAAWACDCWVAQTPEAGFAHTNAVFVGEVTGIVDKQGRGREMLNSIRSQLGWPSEFEWKYYGNHVTFRVTRSWKGVTSNNATVSTGKGFGDCGYPFVVGAEYIVYAHGEMKDLRAGTCSRTSLLTKAAEDMTYLAGIPELPLTAVSMLSARSSLALAAAVGALVLIVTFLEFRRRMPRVSS